MRNHWLTAAGGLSVAAALVHVMIIAGGADWYRFFGAGEQMAQMAEQGSLYPATVTGGIALVLFIWALYGFSGAGLIPRLPLLRTALVVISTVFMARGILGIPAVLFFEHPYFQQLGHSMTFMAVSSAICLVYGACFSVGTWRLWRQRPQSVG